MKGCSRLYCLFSGDILITSFANINFGSTHPISWFQWWDSDGNLHQFAISFLRFLHLAELCPGSFLRSGSICGLLGRNVFTVTLRPGIILKLYLDRENPSIINYFKTNPISLKTSTQFFVPDEKTLDTLVCADALATSRQALVKIWIARVWLGNKYARFICCRLGSAMKVTYSNLKSSLRKEVLHENCQCVLSSMYGPLI